MAKPVMLLALEESDFSFHALEWTLDHFFVNKEPAFQLKVIHARPIASTVLGPVGPSSVDLLPIVEADLKRKAEKIVAKAKEICSSNKVNDVAVEVKEGDPRNVLCEAVDENHAELLVMGSHGYGALARVVLGSVSDYCTHHAHCSVMIVKTPKVLKHKHN